MSAHDEEPGSPAPTGDQSTERGSRGSSPSRRISRPKRWLFRLLALTLAPLLFLGLVELALRLVGFGYPTPFFLAAQRGGQTVLVENAEFGRRFFPPALARAPLPMVLPRRKPTGVYRIFVMGGSASKGEPEPSIGFARILKVLLEARCEGQRFEIVNVAATAITTFLYRLTLRANVSQADRGLASTGSPLTNLLKSCARASMVL